MDDLYNINRQKRDNKEFGKKMYGFGNNKKNIFSRLLYEKGEKIEAGIYKYDAEVSKKIKGQVFLNKFVFFCVDKKIFCDIMFL